MLEQLEMWANAQRDGRPVECRWRPLFNAAKFGWRPILECRIVCNNCTQCNAHTWTNLTMVWLFPPQNCPFPCWHLDLIGLPESGTQMVTWSFQPFLQGSLVWHTDTATERATDRPRYSVRCGVIMRNYVGYGNTNNFATINLLSRHVYVQNI